MGSAKTKRQKAARRARLAAAAAARRRSVRRRWTVAAALAGLFAIGLVVVTVLNRNDDVEDLAAPSTTTTTGSVASAAGKPCLPVSEDAPEGAPHVPVKPGPPPAELVTEDLEIGTGAPVPPDATITVNYIGVACSTGNIFDSSYGREPATFPLDGVIEGWQKGIPGMNAGGRRLLGIPPGQAYGSRGRPPDIAPDETLWFVVEVLDVRPQG